MWLLRGLGILVLVFSFFLFLTAKCAKEAQSSRRVNTERMFIRPYYFRLSLAFDGKEMRLNIERKRDRTRLP